jgi:hypothetical protein
MAAKISADFPYRWTTDEVHPLMNSDFPSRSARRYFPAILLRR